jgi:hypothetical protein
MVIGVLDTVKSVVNTLPATPMPPVDTINAPEPVLVALVVELRVTPVVDNIPVLGTNDKFALAKGDNVVGNEPEAVPNNG